MRSWRQALGRLGEDLAAGHLGALGYSILDRNWRNGRLCELDLIARDPDCVLAFVEVKTRCAPSGALADSCQSAIEAVGLTKRRRIRTAAFAWLSQYRYENRAESDPPFKSLRFDLVVVTIERSDLTAGSGSSLLMADGTGASISHVPGAFF
ncbi:MAG: YraN family protein [Cyanobacteria bacterium HKST-UBA02]|nr:YraN family protein [Cyanobacteria bacterium HKST-UBA02]